MTIEQLYEIYLRHPSIRTDTRQLRQGDLFFALKGTVPNIHLTLQQLALHHRPQEWS
jgi:UDP-N-acetylmuramyl pentapeptide synthase